MKIIEGTVEEIVEYERRTAVVGEPEAPEETPEPDGDEPPAAVTAEHGFSGEDGFQVQRHIYSRGVDAAIVRRVVSFIEQLPAATKVEIGTSERTRDRLSNYLMVRDNGPQYFGAVVYVEPRSGRLTFRLRPAEVADISDEGVVERNVSAKQRYAIRCWLDEDAKLPLALMLTQRALDVVRS